MFRIKGLGWRLVGVGLLLSGGWAARAQSQEPPASAPAAASSPEAVLPPEKAVLGTVSEKTSGGAGLSDFCSLNRSSTIPEGALLVVVEKHRCSSRYGGSFSKEYWKVLFNGKELYVPLTEVTTLEENRVTGFSPAQRAASLEEWTRLSAALFRSQQQTALQALDATAKHGVAILKARIFDVSEHTEGTGFSITLFNTGRKALKYVNISVIGYNAVNDPVRDRLRGSTTLTFRGVGPIEPKESGSYSKDYMWMTDLVESFRITQVKLEFMDGTSKVLSDIGALSIKARDYAILSADTD